MSREQTERDALLRKLDNLGTRRSGDGGGLPICDEAADFIRALPTVQAETAVVGALRFYGEEWWHEPNGDPRIPGDAKGWTCEPSDKLIADEGRLAREVLETLGYYAGGLSQAPVSTAGEQPGMSEGEPVDRVMAVLNYWFDGRARIDRNSEMVQQLAALCSSTPTLPDNLLSLSEAATAGEWQNGFDDLEGIVSPSAGDGNVVCLPPYDSMALSLERWDANAALIVASVNFIRTLAARQNRAGETT